MGAAMEEYMSDPEGQVAFVGEATGAAAYTAMCKAGAKEVCDLAETTLKHAVAFVGFRINDRLPKHMREWKTLTDPMHHGANIAWGGERAVGGGWIQKSSAALTC